MILRRPKINVTLALPAYLQSDHFLFDSLEKLSLKKFFNSGKYIKSKAFAEGILTQLLLPDFKGKLPYAAFSALGNGLAANKWWLRVDPVELFVDGANICLVGRDHLSLEDLEKNELLTCLNDLLKQDNLMISAGSNHEWFLELAAAPNVNTYPLHDVIAKDIRAFMPYGEKQDWWHKLLTELQMLLFSHAINSKRQMENKPVINSVWPWGEGQITPLKNVKEYAFTWTDSSLVKGILKNNDLHEPKNSRDFQISDLKDEGQYLITLNHYHSGIDYLQELIANLLLHIKQREIDQLEIHLGNSGIYKWKRPRLLL